MRVVYFRHVVSARPHRRPTGLESKTHNVMNELLQLLPYIVACVTNHDLYPVLDQPTWHIIPARS